MQKVLLAIVALLICACGGAAPEGDPVSERHIFIMWGQSNLGHNANSPPAGTPVCTDWKMWRDVQNSSPDDKVDTTLRSVVITTAAATVHGPELQLALDGFTAGYKGGIIKVQRNGTDLRSDWIPGGTYHGTLLATVQTAMLAFTAAYPNDTLVPWIMISQGEAEAVDSGGGGQSAADAWATDAQSVVDAINTRLTSLGYSAAQGLVVWRATSHLANRPGATPPSSPATYLTNVRTQQALLVSNNAPNARLLDTDAYSINVDETHFDGTGQNSGGADTMLAVISMNLSRLGQSALATASANALLDHVLGGGDYTALANMYAAQFVGDPAGAGVELTGGSYARKTIANNGTNFANASGGNKALGASQKFFQPTAALGTVSHVALFDAAAAGNRLFSFKVPATRAADYGQLQFLRSGLRIATFGGAFSTYLANKLLDLFFGGTAYARPATVYLAALYNGTEVVGNGYTRVAVTNNATNFPAAAARAKSLATLQTFPKATGAWSVNQIGIYDAAAAGNQLFLIPLNSSSPVAANQTLRIPAGALSFVIP